MYYGVDFIIGMCYGRDMLSTETVACYDVEMCVMCVRVSGGTCGIEVSWCVVGTRVWDKEREGGKGPCSLHYQPYSGVDRNGRLHGPSAA